MYLTVTFVLGFSTLQLYCHTMLRFFMIDSEYIIISNKNPIKLLFGNIIVLLANVYTEESLLRKISKVIYLLLFHHLFRIFNSLQQQSRFFIHIRISVYFAIFVSLYIFIYFYTFFADCFTYTSYSLYCEQRQNFLFHLQKRYYFFLCLYILYEHSFTLFISLNVSIVRHFFPQQYLFCDIFIYLLNLCIYCTLFLALVISLATLRNIFYTLIYAQLLILKYSLYILVQMCVSLAYIACIHVPYLYSFYRKRSSRIPIHHHLIQLFYTVFLYVCHMLT